METAFRSQAFRPLGMLTGCWLHGRLAGRLASFWFFGAFLPFVRLLKNRGTVRRASNDRVGYPANQPVSSQSVSQSASHSVTMMTNCADAPGIPAVRGEPWEMPYHDYYQGIANVLEERSF